MSDEDKAKLIEVLKRDDVRVDGKIKPMLVCKATGLSPGCVYNFLRRDPYWHAQVEEANVGKLLPTEAEIIDPPPTPAGVLVSNETMAQIQAILRQQKKMVAKDWEGLGMDQSLAARAERMAMLGSTPMLQTVKMIYGGLVRQVTQLDEFLEKDAERIRDNLLPAELDKEGVQVEDGKVQREWRYCWFAGSKLSLEIYKSLHQTQAILARAARDLKALGDTAKPPEKGVFEMQPLSERTADDQ